MKAGIVGMLIVRYRVRRKADSKQKQVKETGSLRTSGAGSTGI